MSANISEGQLARLEKRCAELEKRLKEVEAERVTYLQNVSHQLVAPLNAIKWHIENITNSRLSMERGQKVMRSIYSQATIAVHLAKNFALMSNLEADHALTALKEPLQPVALFALLVNLADDFQPLGWDRNIQIHVDPIGFEKAPEVLVMRPLINQVFSNIIENAVKYSNEDSKILISGRHDPQTDVVYVHVKNRGIPLPDKAAEVFDRGYRSDAAKNKYPAGTGFGLYIAKRIVEIHEGRILAATMSGGVTTFSVVLSVRGLQGKARIRDAKDRFAR